MKNTFIKIYMYMKQTGVAKHQNLHGSRMLKFFEINQK